MPPELKLLIGAAKELAETRVGHEVLREAAGLLEHVVPKSVREELAATVKIGDVPGFEKWAKPQNVEAVNSLPPVSIGSDAPKMVHVSRASEVKSLRDVDPGIDDKPKGLWYSLDHGWARTGIHEYDKHSPSFAYVVDTSRANILKISSTDELKNMHENYGTTRDAKGYLSTSETFGEYSKIDWRKVSADYDGVQFDNWQKSFQLPSWYFYLDTESGSVWNASKVKLEPLGQMPPSRFGSNIFGKDVAVSENQYGWKWRRNPRFYDQLDKQLKSQ